MERCCRGVPAALQPELVGSSRPCDRLRCLRCRRLEGQLVIDVMSISMCAAPHLEACAI